MTSVHLRNSKTPSSHPQLIESFRRSLIVKASHRQASNSPFLQSLPKVIGVEEPAKLAIHVHDVHVALAVVPHNRPAENLPVGVALVALNVDAQATVHAQSQQHFVLDGILAAPGDVVAAVDALHLELLQAGGQVGLLLGEALGLDFGVRRGLGGAELLGVEACDFGGVGRGRMRGDEVFVLRVEGV